MILHQTSNPIFHSRCEYFVKIEMENTPLSLSSPSAPWAETIEIGFKGVATLEVKETI